MKNFNFQPIGFFHCNADYKYERRRQAISPDSTEGPGNAEMTPGQVSENQENTNTGMVQLLPDFNFEQALQGLMGFEHIWLIYLLDRNQGWKPMVRPPGFTQKQGVFATRAPYRPNPIGLSAVGLGKIDKLKVHVFDHDLLDGTPILDLKPYLPYCDSIPDSAMGWREIIPETYQVNFSAKAIAQIDWLESQGLHQLRGFIQEQLQSNPTDNRRKRISAEKAEAIQSPIQSLQKDPNRGTENLTLNTHYILAYRIWRIRFSIRTLTDHNNYIIVKDIFSNYSQADLNNSADPYGDRDLHIKFNQVFQD